MPRRATGSVSLSLSLPLGEPPALRLLLLLKERAPVRFATATRRRDCGCKLLPRDSAGHAARWTRHSFLELLRLWLQSALLLLLTWYLGSAAGATACGCAEELPALLLLLLLKARVAGCAMATTPRACGSWLQPGGCAATLTRHLFLMLLPSLHSALQVQLVG